MIRFLLTTLFFINSLFGFSTSFSNEDLKVFKELGIEKSFMYDDELNRQFIYYSSKSKISEYNRNLKRYGNFLPKIKKEFSSKGVPQSLIFISMIETGFNNSTGSKSRPAGLWQFMPSTASVLGLKVNDYIDERLDIPKSSKVAVRYISNNNRKFNKWYLAILAYNCGEGKVIEAVSRAMLDQYLDENPNSKYDPTIRSYKNILDKSVKGKRSYSQLYDIYSSIKYLGVNLDISRLIDINGKDYLPKSSRIYLRKIVALSILENRGAFYEGEKNSSFVSVNIKRGMTLKGVSSAIRMNHKKLVEMNKQLKKQIVPKSLSSYHIYIPKDKLEIFNANKNSIPIVKEKDVIKKKANKKSKKSIKNKKKIDKKSTKKKKVIKKNKKKKSTKKKSEK